MTSNWETIRLGDVAIQHVEPFSVVADEEYVNLGVKWYAEGVFARKPKLGSTIKGSRLFRVKPRQFIYNRMFATEGSFALVPGELASGVVSNEFPVFDLDESTIVPEYLAFYFQQRNVWEFVAQECVGTTKSRSRWKEERFLAHQISLPPLAEQRRIVDLISSLDAAIEASETAVAAAARVYAEISQSLQGPPTKMLDLLVSIDAGKSPSGIERMPLADERAVLKVSAIGKYGFEPSQVKVVPESAILPENSVVEDGNLLMVRANGVLSRVGSACLVAGNYPNLYLCDKTLRLNFDSAKIDVEWALAWIQSPAGRDQIESVTTGSDMRNISQRAIKELLMPTPSIALQRPMADVLLASRQIAASRRAHAESLRKLRDELLTSLLSGAHTIPESYDEVMTIAERPSLVSVAV